MSVRQLCGCVVALKVVVLAMDPTVRLYLGDSAAFLAGAWDTTWLPTDRSFTYSLLIRALVWPTGSLWTLLGWQALAGTATALLTWLTLTRHLGVPSRLAAAAAIVLAVEPAQLYYERMVLAETAGLAAFAAFFVAAGAYLASGRPAWLPVIGALGVAAASLRMNYLPVVLVISLVVPLLAALDARHRVRGTALLVHCAVAVCSVAALHMAYRQSVAVIFNVPPSYLARAGFMQLGLVTPLITDAHLQRAGLPPDLRAHLQFPLAERRARMPHMWAPGGLVHELRRRSLDVEAIARQLSRDALTDNPLGVARLGIETVGDYFRKDGIEHALHNDLGRREIPPDLLRTLRNDWRYDATGLPTRDTVVSRYFAGARWWLVGCLLLLAPLSIANAVVHWHTPWRTRALLAALVGLGLVAAHVLFVAVAFYRYLHPLPLFVFVNAVPLGWRIWHARRTP